MSTELTPHMDDLIKCRTCELDRERWRFASDKRSKTGRSGECRDCKAAADIRRRIEKKRKDHFKFNMYQDY